MQHNSIQVKKFQELYFKHFGKKISQSEALVMGTKLVKLIEAVYSPENMNMKRKVYEQATPK